ncbi:MAG: hypothetical protein ACXW2O_01720 [Candidatus Aminicenantales bacterium]
MSYTIPIRFSPLRSAKMDNTKLANPAPLGLMVLPIGEINKD